MRRLHHELSDALRGLGRRLNMSREEFAERVCVEFPEATLSVDVLRRMTGDMPHHVINPLCAVAMLARLGETGILDGMANAAGFALVPMAKAGVVDAAMDVARGTAEAMRTESEVVRSVLDAIEDGVVSDEELLVIEQRVRADFVANQVLLRLAVEANARGKKSSAERG
jgi:hypothetical protein